MLEVAPATYEAAKYAVENWHYSRTMPVGKLTKFGVWESGKFKGAILFGRGATPNLPKPYGLTQYECCELVRVALTDHVAPVSQMVAIALKKLKQHSPGLRLVVSFADPDEGHKGGIYQAGNWVFAGYSPGAKFFRIHGKKTHPRSVGAMGGIQSIDWVQSNLDPNAQVILTAPKLRYLYPLDKPMRRKISKYALPYSNAVEGLEASRGNSVAEEQVQSLPTALGEV